MLVTGATGTVGRAVVRALLTRDDVHVRVGVRRPDAFPRDAVPGDGGRPEPVRLDYDAPETLAAAFAGVDAFFFVSPLVEAQVAQGERVLAAAVAAGVRHCVRLSSRSAGWDHESELRAWHRALEERVAASGMTFTQLRPCSFMQNVLGPPLEQARSAGILPLPLGAGRIPFVDAADLGEVAARCLLDATTHHGHTYVLTGAQALTGDELAAALSARLGHAVRYAAVPHAVARATSAERGVPAWLVEAGLRVYARALSGEEAEVDPTLAALLGRAPGTFVAFVEREIAAG